MTQVVSALRSGARMLRDQGPRRTIREGSFFVYEQAVRTLHSATGRAATGQNVYDREWDVLLLLDGCRVDLLREVAPEYEFVGDVDTHRSLGSHSYEWMERTFTPAYAEAMADTVHVTANPFSDRFLVGSRFAALDEVWRYGWDDAEGTTPPRPVTERAIASWRETSADRMIVHYMQPHVPFLGYDFQAAHDPEDWQRAQTEKTVWAKLRDGDLDFDAVWTGYRDNLRAVLSDVELLLENLDAETVVLSADHGNAVGEYGIYGHPRGVAIEPLREVPWVRTTATDAGTFEPSLEREATESIDGDDLEARLESLGYV